MFRLEDTVPRGGPHVSRCAAGWASVFPGWVTVSGLGVLGSGGESQVPAIARPSLRFMTQGLMWSSRWTGFCGSKYTRALGYLKLIFGNSQVNVFQILKWFRVEFSLKYNFTEWSRETQTWNGNAGVTNQRCVSFSRYFLFLIFRGNVKWSSFSLVKYFEVLGLESVSP